MAQRHTRPDPIYVLSAEESAPRPIPQGERIERAVRAVRTKVDKLGEQYDTLDDLLVGCLANDTGQADALGALTGEVASSRGELDRLGRLVDALAHVVRSHHQDNKRRAAELEVIAQRQEAILRSLASLGTEAPAFADSTIELDPEDRDALFAKAGLEL